MNKARDSLRQGIGRSAGTLSSHSGLRGKLRKMVAEKPDAVATRLLEAIWRRCNTDDTEAIVSLSLDSVSM